VQRIETVSHLCLPSTAFGFSFNSVPSIDVFIAFSECNVSNNEPKKKSGNWEEVFGWNQKGIHNKEATQEMDSQKNLCIAISSESSMTI